MIFLWCLLGIVGGYLLGDVIVAAIQDYKLQEIKREHAEWRKQHPVRSGTR